VIVDLDKIFVTADHHFGHKLMKELRGFASVHEMDERMVEMWNSKVGPDCTVYHLGDVAFRCSPGYLFGILGRLNGNKILLRGNHDHKVALKPPAVHGFSDVRDVLELKIKESGHPLQPKGQHLKIWLSHYPHASWPSSARGSVHLHGHSHGKTPPRRLRADVGVDCHGLAPLSLREALTFVLSQLDESRRLDEPVNSGTLDKLPGQLELSGCV